MLMPCAVMSNSLNSIMLLLRDAIDSQQNITDMDAVSQAVTSLELFPMTMNQLQDTRIGLILKNIRHKVEPSLQKRIRFVIKAWQQLIKPGTSASEIVPKPNISPLSNSQSVNSISDNGNFKHHDSLKIPVSESSISRTQSLGSTRKRSRQGLDSPNIDIQIANQNITKPKIPRVANDVCNNIKHSNSSASLLNSISSPVISNGRRPNSGNLSNNNRPTSIESDKSNSHKIESVNTSTKEVTKLSKVKSTAELLETAGHCLDSATLNKILSNKIPKESDEPKSIVTALAKSNKKTLKTPVVKATEPIAENTVHATEKEGKNAMLAKFLASSAAHDTEKEPSHEEVNSPSTVLVQEKIEFEKKAEVVVESDDGKKKHKKHKKKSKHKEDKYVTNRMDEWPILPPVPEIIDWESLDKNFVSEELKKIQEDRTGMQTVNVCNQLMHVLPWVDTFGEKKKFFPDDSEQSLNDLISSIPEPW